MKKFLSVIIAVMFILSLYPLAYVHVGASSSVKAKLDAFMTSYPNGGRWTGTFDGGSQCYGFAKMVLYNVFEQYHGWYYNGTPTKGLTAIGSITSYSSSNVQNLLSKAKCGDLLQFNTTKQHSMIVYSVESDGVWIYDCNWDNNCGISLRKSSFGAWSGRNSSKLTLLRSTNYQEDSHTIDTSYGTDFTAYPKSKITAENIFDANHNQISSTSWIGTSDLCTIHEVYTDGCCKVTYPLDSGGSKTVYSKISLFQVDNPPDKPTVYINGGLSHLNLGAGQSITFTFSAPNATSLHLYIYKGSDLLFEGEFAPSASYTRQFYETAQYCCVIISHNAGGSTYSDWLDWNIAELPGQPWLSVKGNSIKDNVYFFWTATSGTTWYDLRIYDTSGNCIKYIPNIYGKSYELSLPAGSYKAMLCSVLYGYYECWTASNTVEFTIAEEPRAYPSVVKYLNNHIYELYYDNLTWEEAEYYCETYRGGHLATVNSAEEQAFLESNLLNETVARYYLGATDKDSEGTWKWVTGEPFEYTKWASGEPNNNSGTSTSGDEDYLEMSPANGEWNDVSPLPTCGFICEIETENYTPLASVVYNGHLYELYNYNLSYGEAENFCTWHDGHLTTITSAEEQAAVYGLLSGSTSHHLAWLGATCINRGENWTSGNDNWKWEDDTIMTYSNWATAQPDYWNGLETCLMMYKSDGTWNDLQWDYCCNNKDSMCFILEKNVPINITGDANGDSKVNAKDITLLKKFIAGITAEDQINLVNADVNQDGKHNSRDVTAIKKFVAYGEF